MSRRILVALNLVHAERERQDALRAAGKFAATCADEIPDDAKYRILGEEFGEVARALNEGEGPERLRQELVEVAAVATAWVEALL